MSAPTPLQSELLRELAKEGPEIVEKMRKAGLEREANIVDALCRFYG